MTTHSIRRFLRGRDAALLALFWSLAVMPPAQAQPTIVSTVPASGAVDVSPSAPVVFTFSDAMDTNMTSAQFFSAMAPLTPLPTTSSWSSDLKTLTCKPNPPFPGPYAYILWNVDGQDLVGDSLTGNASDYFETGSNGGGVASGTNRITTYSVGTFWMYDQTNSGAPTLDPVTSYNFSASVILASNLAATGASLAPPGGVTQPMSRNIVSPEQFYLYGYSSNLTIFQANYPNGSYGFTVQAANSNQQVSVNLPAGLAQPNAPHVSNFSSVQTVDPTQPFTLLWDAFPPAGATNIIVVMLTDTQGATVALSNGLPGSATSIAIPVGVLQPSAAYSGSIDFESYLGNTNASYGTAAFRATTTRFTLATSSGAVTAPLVLTNTVRSAGAFGFQILSSPGQTLTVEYATNLKSGVWNTLLVTNSPGRVQISDPVSAANAPRFYRARKGG